MAQVCTTYTNIDGEEEEYCYDDGTTDTSTAPTDDVDYTKIYEWNENADGSKQKLNPDGSIAYQDPDGSTYSVKNGVYTTESEGKTWKYDTKQGGFVDDAGKLIKDAPSNLLSKVMSAVKANPLAALGTAYGAIKSLSGSDSGGYNVPIPKMEMVQQQIDYNDPNRRPGAAGRQYLTDTRFVKEGDAASLAGAKGASAAQAAGILAAYKPTAAPAVNPWAGKMKQNWNPTEVAEKPEAPPAGLFGAPQVDQKLIDLQSQVKMAGGGMTGRYLQGGTDGMADKIPANIDGEQPAALSHGEFVIPADVVSHLGNGNSEAGADKLYQMMARIRKARTGTEKQGKKINPDKFMPGGLAAAYAAGGKVQHYIEGGNVTTGAGGVPLDTSKTSTLSPWAGDYVTNMLGKTEALANAPMQVYGGPLTAGASNLQQQGFAGLSETAAAGYQPGKFTNQFTAPMPYQAQTTDFLGNPNSPAMPAYAVQKPMGNQLDPGAAYRATGMPLEDSGPAGGINNELAFYAMPAKTAADRAGTPPTGPLSGLAGLLQGMGAAQPAPAVGEDGRPIRPDESGGMMQPQVMPQQGGMAAPQPSQPVGSIAQQYMNPYLQAALNPQLEEARRQSQITQQQNAAKMTGAGAFGGSRQALLDAETQRSLGANLANITGAGYNTAYDKAMQQFNADQQRKMQEAQFGATQGLTAAQTAAQYGEAAQKANEASRQYSADFGLKSLSDLMRAGETQRNIEAEGIAADKRQFEEQQARPYTNLEFQRKMLEGLPIGASTTSVNQDALSKMQSDISGLASLYKTLANLGIKTP